MALGRWQRHQTSLQSLGSSTVGPSGGCYFVLSPSLVFLRFFFVWTGLSPSEIRRRNSVLAVFHFPQKLSRLDRLSYTYVYEPTSMARGRSLGAGTRTCRSKQGRSKGRSSIAISLLCWVVALLQDEQKPSNVCINRNYAGDTPVRWPCDDSKMSSWANFVESVPLFPPSCSS